MIKQCIKNHYGTFKLHEMVAVLMTGEVQGIGTIEKINDAKDIELLTVEIKLYYFISAGKCMYWKDKESSNITVPYYDIVSVESYMNEVLDEIKEIEKQLDAKRIILQRIKEL